MKALRSTLIVLLLCSTTAIAAPASESSIKQLLSAMQAQKLIEDMRSQLDLQMDNLSQELLEGKAPTPEQQKAITNMKYQMNLIMQKEYAWEKLEPIFFRLYKDSFSEEEVEGMLAFYKTPAGQAVIYKMPVLMQQTMLEVQKISYRVNPEMKKVQMQFAAEMAAIAAASDFKNKE